MVFPCSKRYWLKPLMSWDSIRAIPCVQARRAKASRTQQSRVSVGDLFAVEGQITTSFEAHRFELPQHTPRHIARTRLITIWVTLVDGLTPDNEQLPLREDSTNPGSSRNHGNWRHVHKRSSPSCKRDELE